MGARIACLALAIFACLHCPAGGHATFSHPRPSNNLLRMSFLKGDQGIGHMAREGWAAAKAKILEHGKASSKPMQLSGKDSMLCGAIAGFIARIVVAPCKCPVPKKRTFNHACLCMWPHDGVHITMVAMLGHTYARENPCTQLHGGFVLMFFHDVIHARL